MNFNNPKKSYDSSTNQPSHASQRNAFSANERGRENYGLAPTYEDYDEFFAELYDYPEDDDGSQSTFNDEYPASASETDEVSVPHTLTANEPDKETQAAAYIEAKTKLVWNEGNDWTLKREFFSFNQPSTERYNDRTVTLTFSQKEWDRLMSISEKFGMPVEDYIECCALKIQPLPFGTTNNAELWKRLLSFQDKMEQFENLLEFCSDELKNKVFRSENILRYWLERFNDALEQIDIFFHLLYLYGRNTAYGAL